MEISRLAAKQKRCKEIRDYAQHDVGEGEIRRALLQTLSSYQSILADVWKKQPITPEDVVRIDTVERELERLHNEARLSAGTRS